MDNQEKIRFLHRIPLTRIKLAIARLLYKLVRLVIRSDIREISRYGIHYKVDLSEGIDLSLFLFSNFQGYITRSGLFTLPKDAVIIDVGANIGSMTLQFAKIAETGHVYAVEPTSYAFAKLTTNLSLNPALADRVTAVQVFASDQSQYRSRLQAYSSWKIDASADNAHPLHGGTLKSGSANDAVPAVTLDDLCEQQGIGRVDYIKIDTDGHELKVLKGAIQTMRRWHPVIVFEAGLYIFREQNIEFRDFYELLAPEGYTFYNAHNNQIINMGNYVRHIPLYYTIDIIAIPSQVP
jgi:FkbM family methyltransferase